MEQTPPYLKTAATAEAIPRQNITARRKIITDLSPPNRLLVRLSARTDPVAPKATPAVPVQRVILDIPALKDTPEASDRRDQEAKKAPKARKGRKVIPVVPVLPVHADLKDP